MTLTLARFSFLPVSTGVTPRGKTWSESSAMSGGGELSSNRKTWRRFEANLARFIGGGA